MRARDLALPVAALLVAAACGAGGDNGSSPSTSSGSTAGSEPAGAPITSAQDTPAGSPEDPVAPVTTAAVTSSAPGGSAPTTSTPPPSPVPAPGPVGAFAGRYLRPSESASVLVEVLAQDGAEPRTQTVARVADVLASVSGKPVTTATRTVGGSARQWTGDELRALADEVGTPPSPDRAALRLLFLHGGSADNERAVGIAVRADVAAVFADRVDEAAGLLGNRAAAEEAVAVHELGHLLGLVDLVVDTGREDPEHPGHSASTGSVMYYAVESTLLGSVLQGGPPRDFDEQDLDDLARIRSG